ncbi:MAG: ComEC/Rec2 family competence protein, partial [Bacteroidota bacterium]
MQWNRAPFCRILVAYFLGAYSPSWIMLITALVLCFFPLALKLSKRKKRGCQFIALLLLLFHLRVAINNEHHQLPSEESLIVVLTHLPSSSNWSRTTLKDLKTNEKIAARFDLCDAHFSIGDTLFVQGNWQRIRNTGVQGEFDAISFYNNKGIYFQGFAQFIGKINNSSPSSSSLFSSSASPSLLSTFQSLSPSNQALIQAMMTGDKSKLTLEQKELFKTSGVMHILAVSGMHVGLIAAIPLFILKLLGKRKWMLSLTLKSLTLLGIWWFAYFTGLGSSVVRAAIMFSIFLFLRDQTNSLQGVNVMAGTAFFMLFWQPNALFDIGFQLSFMAVFGIITLPTPFQKHIRKLPVWLRLPTNALLISIVAQLSTAPLILFHFHEIPTYSLLSALSMAPLMILCIYLGIVSLFMTAINMPCDWLIIAIENLLDLNHSIAIAIHQLPNAMSTGYFPSSASVFLGVMFLLVMGVKSKFQELHWKESLLSLGMLAALFAGFLKMDQCLTEREIQRTDSGLFILRKKKEVLLISQDEIKSFRVKQINKTYSSEAKMSQLPNSISKKELAGLRTSLEKIGFSIEGQHTPPNTSIP